MYLFLLALHSLVRWVVVVSLLIAVYRAWSGKLGHKAYTRVDESARFWSLIAIHTQLVLGLWLYFISPVVSYFMHNFKTAVHQRQIRFFGMEHITMMLIAIILITIGSAKVKRKTTDQEKFNTWATWLTIGLIIIITSIPWAFSPLTSRPWFRAF